MEMKNGKDADKTWLTELMSSASTHLKLLLELDKAEGTVSGVAERMKKERSQISLWSQRLERAGLVERLPGEGPRKILRLSVKGRSLLDFLRSMGPDARPAAPPNRELVLQYLKATDASFDPKTQERLAEALSELASASPIEALEEVREAFRSLVQQPKRDGGERHLWSALQYAVPRMIGSPEGARWVMENLYGPLLKCAKNVAMDDALRAQALRLLRQIFQGVPKSREEVLEAAKTICFEKGPTGGLHQEAQELLRLARLIGDEEAVALLGWVLDRSKSDDAEERQRAVELLPHLIRTLSPKGLL